MERFNPLLAAAAILVSSICFISATDPDPLQDFCVADLNSTISVNGFACKPASAVKIDDFVSQTFRSLQPVSTPNQFVATPLFAQQLPGLNTAGISVIRGDLGPGGVNVPHIHPRANEFVAVQEGTVQIGFVDTTNKLFMETLRKGDVIIIPRGLVHFQINVGDTPASFLAFFNSQNPGLERIPDVLFASGIPDTVLQKSLQLSAEALATLKKRFSSSS